MCLFFLFRHRIVQISIKNSKVTQPKYDDKEIRDLGTQRKDLKMDTNEKNTFKGKANGKETVKDTEIFLANKLIFFIRALSLIEVVKKKCSINSDYKEVSHLIVFSDILGRAYIQRKIVKARTNMGSVESKYLKEVQKYRTQTPVRDGFLVE